MSWAANRKLPAWPRPASLSFPLTGARANNVSYLGAARCRRKFELFYPDGFQDETYLVAERSYKERAHLEWQAELGPADFRKLLARGEFRQIADIAVRIESRTNLLFSFEKMALRDALEAPAGARLFAHRAAMPSCTAAARRSAGSRTGCRPWPTCRRPQARC